MVDHLFCESPRPIMGFVGTRNKRLCLTTEMLCAVCFCSITWPVLIEVALILEL